MTTPSNKNQRPKKEKKMMTNLQLKRYLEAFKLKNDYGICESCFKKTLKIVLDAKGSILE